jgi:hypothetical protein
MHRDWVPHAAEFLGTDMESGKDVDFIADLHFLSKTCGTSRFDGIISCSTFEHVKYPWLAALEIGKVLRIGGMVFVQTHQTFPVHNYPNDYWRFTKSALAALFNGKIGYEITSSAYEYPCQIIAPNHNPYYPSFLNVCITARKVAETPDHFLEDL